MMSKNQHKHFLVLHNQLEHPHDIFHTSVRCVPPLFREVHNCSLHPSITNKQHRIIVNRSYALRHLIRSASAAGRQYRRQHLNLLRRRTRPLQRHKNTRVRCVSMFCVCACDQAELRQHFEMKVP